MGRAKLEIKYRENLRARHSTYMARMKGVKKKASELSLLCGVDVLVASLSPELNTVEFWPEKDTPEFHRIRERYLHFRKKNNNCSGDEGNENNEQQIPCLSVPFPSFSLSIFHEEMVAMEMKLKEVRERIYFFQASSQNENHVDQCQVEEEQLQAYLSIEGL
uniref:MADS-box protein-like protein n=1 Tax=Cymbidium goeringii TaxID=112607 RepID=A0A455LA52_9ASPA|nr:MADS-box protein-like protein [Cymbidium goeringii]